MNILIVYDSLYGNTEKIAQEIGENLPGSKLIQARQFTSDLLKEVELLIVGSPTHGGRPSQATKEFLNKISDKALKNIGIAAFDTRMSIFFTKLFGYSAPRIAKVLEEKGGRLIVKPEGFIVTGSKGPLKEVELERAAGWAKGIKSL